ncbi:MAG: hypothetical protein KKB25_01590 [Nanoarchaeota archaeon]|nr:hypothetical protein [Nanoarchaeota archaeon]
MLPVLLSAAFVFIYIYAGVDWHNYKIWRNRNSKMKKTRKTSPQKSAI